jgi:hypothetical protein
MRGLVLPEHNHPKWNDFLRACASSQLTLAMLKLTLLANYGRGPFKSGRFGYTVAKAAEKLMSSEQVDEDWLAQTAEHVAFDNNMSPEEFGELTRDRFLESPGVKTRIKEASSYVCVPCDGPGGGK